MERDLHSPAAIEGADVADVLIELAPRLVVPHGLQAGRPPTLQPWMLEFLRGAFAPGVREGALTCGRKNGKSSLVALALLAWLAAPEALGRGQHWRGAVASETGRLAAELRDLLSAFMTASGIKHHVRRSPAPGAIEAGDAEVTFHNATASTGLALGSDLAIVDEAGVLKEAKRPLWDSMVSSTSARRRGRFLALGAQYTGPMFRELLDRADDPAVHVTCYAAAPDCALEDRAAWAEANPGLGSIKSVSYMAAMARRAMAATGAEYGFRGHELNAAVDTARDSIVGPEAWRGCCGELPDRRGPVALGIDLGGGDAMSAIAAYWPASGRLEAWGAWPGGRPIREREREDKVAPGRYRDMVRAGELTLYGRGSGTPVAPFLQDVAANLRGCRIRVVAADTYRQDQLRDGLAEARITAPVHIRATRADKAADAENFRDAVGEGRVRANSDLLTLAVQESSVEYDEQFRPRLTKKRDRGRIDAVAAAVLAVSFGEQLRRQRPRRIRWEFPGGDVYETT